MADKNTLATYYVQILPSAKGIQGNLESLITGNVGGVGEAAGASIGTDLTLSLGKTLAKGLAALGLGKMIADSIRIGSSFESDFAMLSTIMDKGAVSTDNMKASIAELSGELAVSQSEIANATYSVISATGDTAGALQITEQAAKLALAGATDTNSAVSTLTATMNAYHMSAEDVQHISDSLLTTQNLGVTTVADLSANMGRAIASASAYGVSLENLEAAYIGTTKGGINTAESTTYISSMLKELGKDGSKVSDIIKSQTGKSFADLMADGQSLGDVLNLLMESVDNDSTALMNLWGSAEAGKAANAIVNTGLSEFNDNLTQLQTATGTTEASYSTMADTFDHKSKAMKTAIDNLKIKGFEAMAPAITELADNMAALFDGIDTAALTNTVSGIADVAVPALKTGADVLGVIIENLDIIIPLIATLEGLKITSGILGAVGGLTALVSSSSALYPVLAALTGPIGLVITAVVGLGVGLVTLWKTNETFRNNVVKVWDGLKGIAKATFDRIQTNIVQPVQKAWSTISGIADKLKKVFNFSWKLPDLKIPKITIEKGEPPYGLGGKGKLPSFDVQWRAEGAIFTRPTILQGVGEAGPEAVLPIEKLNGMFDRMANRINTNYAVADGATYNVTMNVNGAESPEKWAGEFLETIKRLNRMR